ncbi:hypothetical protein Slin14017_G128310 [Septoria linicola]|nr:hypothetical protein Slin14017_G128310 [Septoria linicola]
MHAYPDVNKRSALTPHVLVSAHDRVEDSVGQCSIDDGESHDNDANTTSLVEIVHTLARVVSETCHAQQYLEAALADALNQQERQNDQVQRLENDLNRAHAQAAAERTQLRYAHDDLQQALAQLAARHQHVRTLTRRLDDAHCHLLARTRECQQQHALLQMRDRDLADLSEVRESLAREKEKNARLISDFGAYMKQHVALQGVVDVCWGQIKAFEEERAVTELERGEGETEHEHEHGTAAADSTDSESAGEEAEQQGEDWLRKAGEDIRAQREMLRRLPIRRGWSKGNRT